MRGRQPDGTDDPDAYHRGIGPSVKLLSAVMDRIAHIAPKEAVTVIQRWRISESLIYTRLWAAAAKNPELVSAAELADFLLALDDTKFWDVDVYPEITELRAARFDDLAKRENEAVSKRLRKGPPRSLWPRKAEPEKVKRQRLYWTVRELNRIQIAGNHLPGDDRIWLASKIGQFPNLVGMSADVDLPGSRWLDTGFGPLDDRYDRLEGVRRLQELEIALASDRVNWNDDPAQRASGWIQQPGKPSLILGDLEFAERAGDDFPKVWDRFGWAHSPTQTNAASTPERLQAEADRVLILLAQLSEMTLSAAIEGVSNWLDVWREQVVSSPAGIKVWLRTWPIAVEATNAKGNSKDDADLSVAARLINDSKEPMDLDTLNTPAGKLVGVLFSACPSLPQGAASPFSAGSAARQMRDAVIAANGRSGLIVRHRLIEELPYFLVADYGWTQEHLVRPLLDDDSASLALWRAFARKAHRTKALSILGGAMVGRATDRRLGRETRERLVFSLVVEALHAFREKRDPAVANGRVQQMLRTLEDEVRATAANAVQQFVRELSARSRPSREPASSAADLFRSAAAPFLRDVWPQERSLATPGVSKAFADLPAASGDAFAEAVSAVERFLVPFECWSMLDYGLYGEEEGATKLSKINNERKAGALLRLLDLTVGTSDGAVVPYDLTDALDQVRLVAPHLVDGPTYRRLSTAARR